MPAEDEEDKLSSDVHVDSDRLKGTDRKSTSRGLMTSGTLVKHWWRTRASRALSVAESEYRAIVKGTAEGLGAQCLVGSGAEGQGQNMDRLHRGQSDSTELR